MEQMRERVVRAIWVAKGFDENTLHQHHEWEDWPVDERTEHVDFDGKTVVTLLHYAWRKCLPEADAALSLMQPEIDRRVAEEKARLLERLRNMPNEVADGIAKKHFVSFEVAKLIGRDIATAFQQENSDAG